LRQWPARDHSDEAPEWLDDILVAPAKVLGSLSISQVANAAGVTWRTARQWLDRLVEGGRIEGSTSKKRYRLA